MEDEVMTTAAPESDVVVTANTSPENTAGYSAVQETTLPPVEGSLSENPVTPEQPGMTSAPLTEREIAQQEIHTAREDAYRTQGYGLESWIKDKYDYDAREAGTYWVAGAINDVNNQMGFLQAFINEDMYGEADLKKHFFDQNLAIARGYANQKSFETAYGFYRAAQEKALAEAEGTGWYMPPEAGYLLGQWSIAEETLANPNASTEERLKADAVKRTASSWFAANNITERGIKCLNLMYFEENTRHNEEMLRLQRQANEIQQLANEASNKQNAAQHELALREYEFQMGEMELDLGFDITDDGIIGHTGEDGKRFGFYNSTEDWIKGNFSKAFDSLGQDMVKHYLGDQYQRHYDIYEANIGDSILKSSYDENKKAILGDDTLNMEPYIISSTAGIKDLGSDKHIYSFHSTENGEPVTRYYYKDKNDVFQQITSTDIALQNNKTLADYSKNFTSDSLVYKGELVQVGNKISYEGLTFNKFLQSNNKYYNSTNTMDTVEEYTKKGYIIKLGYYSTQGLDAFTVMEDSEGNLIEVSNEYGSVKNINKDQIKGFDITINSEGKLLINKGKGHSAEHNREKLLNNTILLEDHNDYNVYATVAGDDIFIYKQEGSGTTINGGKSIITGAKNRTIKNQVSYTSNDAVTFDKCTELSVNDLTKEGKVQLENLQNYMNGYQPAPEKTETKAGLNSDAIIKKNDGKDIGKYDPEVEAYVGDMSTGNTNARDISLDEKDTKDKDSKKSETKDKGDQVIVDAQQQPYVTAFAEGEVMKQIKEDEEDQKKSSKFLEGIQK